MPACNLHPEDKRALVSSVGEKLVQRHGKKKYYQPAEVRQAATELEYPIDVHCWAYCIFTSPEAFKAIHDAAGEVCDYAAMKADVLANLAGTTDFHLPDIDLSWLEWPDIDLSGIFDWFN